MLLLLVRAGVLGALPEHQKMVRPSHWALHERSSPDDRVLAAAVRAVQLGDIAAAVVGRPHMECEERHIAFHPSFFGGVRLEPRLDAGGAPRLPLDAAFASLRLREFEPRRRLGDDAVGFERPTIGAVEENLRRRFRGNSRGSPREKECHEHVHTHVVLRVFVRVVTNCAYS